MREYMANRLAADPAFRKQQAEYNKTWRANHMRAIEQVLQKFRASGCSFCPEKEPCCLDAHHTDESKKEFNISFGRSRRWPVKRIEQELKKCICICTNCHRKLHAGILTAILPQRSA